LIAAKLGKIDSICGKYVQVWKLDFSYQQVLYLVPNLTLFFTYEILPGSICVNRRPLGLFMGAMERPIAEANRPLFLRASQHETIVSLCNAVLVIRFLPHFHGDEAALTKSIKRQGWDTFGQKAGGNTKK
jgi:hypothetical protein